MRLLQRNAQGHDPLRRRVRAVDRRPARAGAAAAGRSTGSTTSTASRPRAARRRRACAAATAIWWDRHDWSATMRVPAVVGSFPEPFLHGIDGKRLPVRVECATPRSDPCKQVSKRLVSYDIPAATGGLLHRQRRRRRCACSSARGRRSTATMRSSGLEKGPRRAGSTRASRADGRSDRAARRRRPRRAHARPGHGPGRRHAAAATTGRSGWSPAPTTPASPRPCAPSTEGTLDAPLRGRRQRRPADSPCRWRGDATAAAPARCTPRAPRPARGYCLGARRAARWPSSTRPCSPRSRSRRSARRRAAGVVREVARTARYTLPLALLVAVVNALVVRDGPDRARAARRGPAVRADRHHARGARLRPACSADAVARDRAVLRAVHRGRRPRRGAARCFAACRSARR